MEEPEESKKNRVEAPSSDVQATMDPNIYLGGRRARRGRIGELIFNKKIALIVSIIILALALITGGILAYRRTMGKKEASPSSEVAQRDSSDGGTTEIMESGEEPPTPTPSPIPELKREDLKLQVFNGSGAPGAARKAKEFLEGLGYKDIEVGNADSYTYDQAEISIKENKKNYLELLTSDLEDKYTVSTESAIIGQESRFDAKVIIGKE